MLSNRKIVGLLLVLVALLPLLAYSVSAAPDLTQRIDEYVQAQMAKMNIPGIGLGVVVDGQVFYSQGYGVCASGGAPVAADTPFLLSSLTKSFTALAVMQLVEQGKLSLDDPVCTYLPWFAVDSPNPSSITVRHLLHHISGIPTRPGLTPPKSGETIEQRARELTQFSPSLPAGQVFQYANHNYVLLGLLVEKISGLSYADYVERNIFQPLAMDRSFTDQRQAEEAGMAVGHQSIFGFSARIEREFPMADLPAGMLISSAGDMTKYLQMLLNDGEGPKGHLLSSSGLNLLWQPGPSFATGAYAMGWMVDDNGSTLSHIGSFANYSSFMLLQPAAGLGIVVLTNQGSILHMGMPETIALGVAALVQEEEPLPVNNLLMWLIPALLAVWAAVNLYSLVKIIRNHGRLKARRHLYLIYSIRLLGAGSLLIIIPMGLRVSLSMLVVLQPDVAVLLIVNAILLILTVAAEIWLTLYGSKVRSQA